MMELLWSGILDRFGQDIVLRRNEEAVSVQALVQPLLDRKDQEAPGPLGLGRQERLRYMGPPEHPLDLDTVVEWQEREYQVRAAHLVGEGICPHWWAMLCPREERAL